LSNDGTYTVSGIGTCTDADLVIPSEYEGKPVTSIASDAFSHCVQITSVTIPDSMKIVDGFDFCYKLKYVYISESVTQIVNQAFLYCVSLATIEVSSDNLTYCSIDGALYNKNATQLIICPPQKEAYSFPSTVKSIFESAFDECKYLTEIVIPDGIGEIPYGAFMHCTNLTSIVIPKSVVWIGGSFAYESMKLTNIYYCGSEKEWQEIVKHAEWDNGAPKFTVHYNHTPN
jgi:hypothetical protein